MKKRLKTLEARAAQDGILLTEAQIVAFEKAPQKQAAHGDIESHHPSHLGSQARYRFDLLSPRRDFLKVLYCQ